MPFTAYVVTCLWNNWETGRSALKIMFSTWSHSRNGWFYFSFHSNWQHIVMHNTYKTELVATSRCCMTYVPLLIKTHFNVIFRLGIHKCIGRPVYNRSKISFWSNIIESCRKPNLKSHVVWALMWLLNYTFSLGSLIHFEFTPQNKLHLSK